VAARAEARVVRDLGVGAAGVRLQGVGSSASGAAAPPSTASGTVSGSKARFLLVLRNTNALDSALGATLVAPRFPAPAPLIVLWADNKIPNVYKDESTASFRLATHPFQRTIMVRSARTFLAVLAWALTRGTCCWC
jgi:hypothetical protein